VGVVAVNNLCRYQNDIATSKVGVA
jgi:hypothetical protein